jgi:ATP-dependent RNA helicase RhlE
VHRIGRTARAGREGWAVTVCDAEQRAWLRDVEKAIRKEIPVFRNHAFHSAAAEHSTAKPPTPGQGGRGRPGARAVPRRDGRPRAA